MRKFINRLCRDAAGTNMVEFGLIAPMFLGIVVGGLDMAHYVNAGQRMQRINANMADLVAQSGTAGIGASEGQINDLFESMDVAAKPFKLRDRGRIIVTALLGVKNGSGNIENRKMWHRCDGMLTGQANKLPGAINAQVTLPENRKLLEDEIMIHSQLAYKFEPLMKFSFMGLFTDKDNQIIERTAFFRPRSKTFVSITPDGQPAKSTCPTT